MASLRNKEAVKIDDWVSDIRGSLVGWIDATDETPPEFEGEAKKLVYSKHKSTNKSWIYKLFGWIGKLAFEVNGSTFAFEVSEKSYPKSAIHGYPDGTTVTGIEKEAGTPDKRVILMNDVHGNRPYMREVGPENTGIEKTKSELQERINELEMMLDAEENKNQELSQEVDRENDSSTGSGTGYGPERYDEQIHEDGLRGDENY